MIEEVSKLYSHCLCPYSRKFKLLLYELKHDFKSVTVNFWGTDTGLLALNPLGTTPVLVEKDDVMFAGDGPLAEYLFDLHKEHEDRLLGAKPYERYVTRFIAQWFDKKFYNEVTRYIVKEKFINIISSLAAPDSDALRAAKKNLAYHLDYIEHLLGQNNKYLASDKFSYADMAAAAQLSTLDYLGDLAFYDRPKASVWYALVKSQPSMRKLLEDSVPGFEPPAHYKDPDF